MRITLTLEPDVAAELERRRLGRGTSLRQEVNSLIRAGLVKEGEIDATPAGRITIRPLTGGEPLIDNFDDIQGILDKYEDPFRL